MDALAKNDKKVRSLDSVMNLADLKNLDLKRTQKAFVYTEVAGLVYDS